MVIMALAVCEVLCTAGRPDCPVGIWCNKYESRARSSRRKRIKSPDFLENKYRGMSDVDEDDNKVEDLLSDLGYKV